MLIRLRKSLKLIAAFFLLPLLVGCAIQQKEPDTDYLFCTDIIEMVSKDANEVMQSILANCSDVMMSMQDGITDPVIREIYAQDIIDVETVSFSQQITIEYTDCDLNKDGITDKIVTIQSPFHGGIKGDSLHILVGDNNGNYSRVSGLSIPLYGFGDYKASMFILDCKTNGFHDILIYGNEEYVFGDSDIILLKYENGNYNPVKQQP